MRNSSPENSVSRRHVGQRGGLSLPSSEEVPGLARHLARRNPVPEFLPRGPGEARLQRQCRPNSLGRTRQPAAARRSAPSAGRRSRRTGRLSAQDAQCAAKRSLCAARKPRPPCTRGNCARRSCSSAPSGTVQPSAPTPASKWLKQAASASSWPAAYAALSRRQRSQQEVAPWSRAEEEHQPRRLQIGHARDAVEQPLVLGALLLQIVLDEVLLQPRSRSASSQGAPLCPHAPATQHEQRRPPHAHAPVGTRRARRRGRRTRSPRGARWQRPPAAPGAAPARAGAGMSGSPCSPPSAWTTLCGMPASSYQRYCFPRRTNDGASALSPARPPSDGHGHRPRRHLCSRPSHAGPRSHRARTARAAASVPARVPSANWKGRQAASKEAANCCANVRATSRRKVSPMTKPRTRPFGLRPKQSAGTRGLGGLRAGSRSSRSVSSLPGGLRAGSRSSRSVSSLPGASGSAVSARAAAESSPKCANAAARSPLATGNSGLFFPRAPFSAVASTCFRGDFKGRLRAREVFAAVFTEASSSRAGGRARPRGWL